jgi:hypothetical protein
MVALVVGLTALTESEVGCVTVLRDRSAVSGESKSLLASRCANGFKNYMVCLGDVNEQHEVMLEHPEEPGGEFPIKPVLLLSETEQMSGSAVAIIVLVASYY